MAKKKRRTNKEKILQRKVEALKANQNLSNNIKKEKQINFKNNPDINVNKILSDDSIIITEDTHIKQDLLKTTIFTILIAITLVALKYYYPSI